MEKKEVKKAKWQFVDGEGYMITMPSGETRTFDLGRLTDEAVKTFLFQYGFKQNVSDAIAGFNGSDSDKLDLMESRYMELVDGIIRSKREREADVKKDSFIEAAVKKGFPREMAEELWAAGQEEEKKKKEAKKANKK